jgi:transposase
VSAPDPRDLRIAELEAKLDAALRVIAQLQTRVQELEAKLAQNSTNSNKPPSSDGPDVQRPDRKAMGKKRGGQPNHDPHRRELIPTEACRKVSSYKPNRCAHCDSTRLGEPELAHRHQVVYLPQQAAPVDEHQAYACICQDCDRRTVAPIPPEVLASAFGPCVVALIAQLSGEYRLPKRSIQKLLLSLFGISISVGAICDQEQTVARALGQPYAEAAQAVKQAQVVNADETGMRVARHKAWLWVAVAELATVFLVAPHRNGEAAQALLGNEFERVLGADRWVSYEAVVVELRQLCWAHLLRDFLGWTELGAAGRKLGKGLLGQARKMFRWWAQVKEGAMTREIFQRRMKPMRDRVMLLLEQATECPVPKIAGMAGDILRLSFGLFTFVDHAGVEPTNNAAERALRHAVVWRKISGGVDSVKGARFLERILTAYATLKQQGRDLRDYLTRAVQALRHGLPLPSLLPAQG